MRNNSIYIPIFFIAFFLLFTAGASARESVSRRERSVKKADKSAQEGNSDELTELKKQISDMRKQIDKMQKRHETDIRVLKKEIKKLTKAGYAVKKEEADIESLRRLAESESAKEENKEEGEETIFTHGGLALQELNPEISVTGDIVNTCAADEDTDRFDFNFRNLGIHIESYMDPYTRFKAAIPVTTSSTKIGEAYLTRYGVLDDVNLTLGKFRLWVIRRRNLF
ncbi:MAG: hypothetical protein DRP85_05860 [Candidatus Makaraimicrobium thalassicum]|nr:MAG: hypothetical protein DRP85_05860 [Candidatus Omnitrophota bacterium]